MERSRTSKEYSHTSTIPGATNVHICLTIAIVCVSGKALSHTFWKTLFDLPSIFSFSAKCEKAL